jgi:hypothetical protein
MSVIERPINMYRFLRLIISVISGLFWVILISFPQEGDKKLVLLTGIFFFPFYLLFLILIAFIVSISKLNFIKKLFLDKRLFTLTLVILLTLVVISFYSHFEEIILLSFFTNVFAFLFSNFIYYNLSSTMSIR